MKLYCNRILSVKGLRTGLFIVCFLVFMATASACGSSEDKLLSELRGEERVSVDSVSEAVESGDADEAPDGMTQENGAGGEETGDGYRNQTIYVHVCGAVVKPGVYELPVGSRFYEAVEAAGGLRGEACGDYLNMAAFLADGSRLEIPTSEEIRTKEESEKTGEGETARSYYTLAGEKGGASGVADDSGGSGADVSDRLVNVNTADTEELCRLPGVGEGRAKAIIEYRQKQGGFQKIEDIMQVSGIGEKMYARMKEYLTVE